MSEISNWLALADINILGLLGGLFWITFALMIIYIIIRQICNRNEENLPSTPPPELVVPSEFVRDEHHYHRFLQENNAEDNQYPTALLETQRINVAAELVDSRRRRFGTPIIPPPSYQPRTRSMRYLIPRRDSQDEHLGTSSSYEQVLQQNFDFLRSVDAKDDQKKSPCPICLGLLEEEPVTSGPCLHFMHTSCLKHWLAKDVKSECPICRAPIYVDEGAPVHSYAVATTHLRPIHGLAEQGRSSQAILTPAQPT